MTLFQLNCSLAGKLPLSLPLLSLLLLATFIRFHNLHTQSFWNDEGNSARLSERSVDLIIEGTASDIHPPLYYLMLRGWRELVGDSEFGLRSLSTMAGILTVATVIALAKRIHSSIWIAGILATMSPPLIYYSQETRMYALVALWAILSTLVWWQWRLTPHCWELGGLYALFTTAGLYTHYVYPFVILWQGLMTLYLLNWKQWRSQLLPYIGWSTLAGIAYLPWLPIFFRQSSVRGRTGETMIEFLNGIHQWLLFGETFAPHKGWLWFASILLLLLFLTYPFLRHHTHKRSLTMLLTATFLPILLTFAVGATRPPFYKLLIITIPFYSLLLGWFYQHTHQRWLWNMICLITLIGMTQSLNNLYNNPAYARADYRGIAQGIAQEGHDNAGIILNAPNQWEVFTYYHRDGAPVYPIPKSDPDPSKINAELTTITAQHDRLYALFWGEAERDPERLVEKWLDSHAFKATDEWIGDVRFVTYAIPPTPATEPTTQLNLVFGDNITLLGYALNATEMPAGDIVQVTLFWQATQPIHTRYKVFLHLVGEDGLIAQRDSEPGGGLALTTTWTAGETIIDNHGVLIPANTPTGNYRLLLGLYDVTDSTARLSMETNTGKTDAFQLATLKITPNSNLP